MCKIFHYNLYVTFVQYSRLTLSRLTRRTRVYIVPFNSLAYASIYIKAWRGRCSVYVYLGAYCALGVSYLNHFFWFTAFGRNDFLDPLGIILFLSQLLRLRGFYLFSRAVDLSFTLSSSFVMFFKFNLKRLSLCFHCLLLYLPYST